MTNDEDGMSKKNVTFQKVPKFQNPKWHFLGLGKRPKRTVQSEVKPKLNQSYTKSEEEEKITVRMFATNPR